MFPIPNELVNEVVDLLDYTDLCTLRLVSKASLRHFNPRLFKSFVISSEALASDHKLIVSVAAGLATFMEDVRTIIIESLPKVQHKEFQGYTRKGSQRLATQLGNCLSKFTNTTSVEWTSSPHLEQPRFLINVARGLETLPKIRNLEIKAGSEDDFYRQHRNTLSYERIPLGVFHNLESIELDWRGSFETWFKKVDLLSMIEASPELRRLRLNNALQPRQLNFSFCEMLKTINLAKLEDISLSGIPLLAENIQALVTPKLRCLDLTNMQQSEDFWKHLWGRCLESRCQLKSLQLSSLEGTSVAPLFDYLLSYSGLQQLVLCPNIASKDEEDIAGRRLWSEIVPKHALTLQDITVRARYEGAFCYGKEAGYAIDQCTKIIDLHISVCEMDAQWAAQRLHAGGVKNSTSRQDSHDLDPKPGDVQSCVLMILRGSMSRLERLTLFITQSNAQRAMHERSRRLGKVGSVLTPAYKIRAHAIWDRIHDEIMGLPRHAKDVNCWPISILVSDLFRRGTPYVRHSTSPSGVGNHYHHNPSLCWQDDDYTYDPTHPGPHPIYSFSNGTMTFDDDDDDEEIYD